MSSILIIANGIDGGIAAISSHLAKGLLARGHSCAIRYVGRPAESCFVDGDKMAGLDSQAIVTGRPRSLDEIRGLFAAAPILRNAIRKHKPDCIFFSGFIPALVFPRLLRSCTNAKFIFWDHAPQNTFTALKKPLFKLSAGFFDRIVSISGSASQSLTTLFGIQQRDITLIPNGIAPQRWQVVPPAAGFSALRLLMPARLDLNQKDPLPLIQAVRTLHEEGIDIKLTFLGSGNHEPAYRAMIASENADSFISILPHTPDVPSAMADHNVVCLSTHFEGLPTVLIEAMMARRLVVATRAQGCIDVIDDNQTGFLVAPGDAIDYASKLRDITRREDIQAIVEKAYTKAMCSFSVDRMLDDFEKLIHDVTRCSP